MNTVGTRENINRIKIIVISIIDLTKVLYNIHVIIIADHPNTKLNIIGKLYSNNLCTASATILSDTWNNFLNLYY